MKTFLQLTIALLLINSTVFSETPANKTSVNVVSHKSSSNTKSAVNHLKIGTQKFNHGKFDEASESATKAECYCDEDAKSLNLKAAAEASHKNYTAAIKLFERALIKSNSEGLNPDTTFFNLAIVYLQKKEFAKTLDYLNQIGNPDGFEYLEYNMGVANINLGNTEDAIDNFKNSIAKNTANERAYYNLGLAYFQNKEYDKCLVCLIKAVKKDPGNVDYNIALANVYEKLDSNKLALKHFENAYRNDSRNQVSIMGIGNSENKLGRFKRAIEYFHKALKLNRKSALAFGGIADANYYLTKYDTAIKYYDIALKFDSLLMNAYVGRGNAKCHFADYYSAIEDYNVAIALRPDNVKAYESRGIAKFRLNRYYSASRDFEKVLELDPAYVMSYDAFISKGFADYNLHNLKAAQQDFESAIKIDSKKSTGYDGLGCVYYALEKFDSSVCNFDKAIAITPDDDLMLTNRGNALYRILEYGKALKDFNKAVSLNPQNEHAFNGIGICQHQFDKNDSSIVNILRGIAVAPSNYELYRNLGISRGYYAKESQEKGKLEFAQQQYDSMIHDHEMSQRYGMDSSVYFINLGYLHMKLNQFDKALEYYGRVVNPAYRKFAENNIGVVIAMRDKGRGLDSAYQYFEASVEKDKEHKYEPPRVNRALISLELGKPAKDDSKAIDSISVSGFRKLLSKDKYYNTYFYYAIMRYFPPHTEHNFKNEVVIVMPKYAQGDNRYLVYEPTTSCFKEVSPKLSATKNPAQASHKPWPIKCARRA